MSDGPHRSLPMKPKWRNVAERAYNGAFRVDEISAAMMPALHGDCQDEMSPRFLGQLRNICEQQETLLFKDNIPARLEAFEAEKPATGWEDGSLKTSSGSRSRRKSTS